VTFAKAFAGTLVAFLAIDVIWIAGVVRPMYNQQLGSLLRASPQLGAALVFYLTYAAGIVYFAVLPALASGDVRRALVNGAALGGLAYGTYALTNYALLEGWTLPLAAADLGWGVILTAVAAACGFLVVRLGS
jgi:uncharacterized membrane protein